MKRSRHIPLFLLLAMGLVVLPAPLEAACDMTPHPESDPCETCRTDACEDTACEDEQEHQDENCCETGCQYCSLPCCSGTAMINVASPSAIPLAPADDRPVLAAPRAPWVDAEPLFHPPRV